MVEETDEDGIDYVEAVAVDGAPLLDHQAETYFARLGKLAWCLQVQRRMNEILHNDSSVFITIFLL